MQADGFIQKPFGFVLDQGKILDLLTGHTLYNDSSVVLRELCQNAIDAVRLQYVQTSPEDGLITVGWDSENSVLVISDNGTGMSQEVIENHLLKVGSSRYQDQKFRELYPDFSPISRFGIGVLSAFMVADEVQIVTVAPEEEQARLISLRSVHGKYLIRLLDKNAPEVKKIGSHGTSFRLKFRPSAEPFDVIDVLSSWILFPRCRVIATVDGADPVVIGYNSPKHALESYLSSSVISRFLGSDEWRVKEKTVDGFTLAYAQRYNKHFREWGLFTTSQRYTRHGAEGVKPPIASCVEGIAVEFSTPGYDQITLLAVCNSVGNGAPKTNVARSAIEGNSDKESLALNVYSVFLQAIVEEQQRLVDQEGFSLTWSLTQLPFMMFPLFGDGPSAASQPDIFQDALAQAPLLLLEDGGKRTPVSTNELEELGSFWTVESILMRSIEQFVKESKLEVTAKTIIEAGTNKAYNLPDGPILANLGRLDRHLANIWTRFEPALIDVKAKDRQLSINWRPQTERWISKSEVRDDLYELGEYQFVSTLSHGGERVRGSDLYIPVSDVVFSNASDFAAVRAYEILFLKPEGGLAKLLFGAPLQTVEDYKAYYLTAEAISNSADGDGFSVAAAERYFRSVADYLDETVSSVRDKVINCIADLGEERLVFDPLAWGQRSTGRPVELSFE